MLTHTALGSSISPIESGPAGRRAAVPLWPVVCPVPQGGGAVIGLATRDVALGSALDSAEGLWHQSPERSGGRQYARQLTGASRPPRCLADVTEEALAVLLQLQSK